MHIYCLLILSLPFPLLLVNHHDKLGVHGSLLAHSSQVEGLESRNLAEEASERLVTVKIIVT